MDFTRQVSRLLDDEHRSTITLLDRFWQAVSGGDWAELQEMADTLERHLHRDIEHHFVFEETALFPRLVDAGDEPMVDILVEEHDTLRAVAAEILPLIRALSEGSFAEAQRPALKHLAVELVERQVSHIQKETMALLPMLDDLLDEDADRELACAYGAGDGA